MAQTPAEREREPVPPEAVVAPRTTGAPTTLQPQHLYKAAGLLFLLALVYRYLSPITETLLLAYAAVLLAVIFNAIVQLIPAGRKWVTAVIGILIVGGIGLLLYLGLPLLFEQLRNLSSQAPRFQQQLEQAQRWLNANTGLNLDLMGPQGQRMLQETFMSGSGSGSSVLARAQGLLGLLFVPLLILFGGLYAAGKPNEQLLSPLMRTVPRDRRLAFRRIFQLLGERLLGYVRGVLIAMLFVGLLSYGFYAVIGVPNSLLLAVIAALTEAIPLVGPWIGGGLAVITAFLIDPSKALWTALAAIVIQQLESNVLTPWAMSRAAEVHPFVTLFALVLFGTLFGFLGVLLAVPLVLFFATVVEVLWIERALDTDEDRIAPVVQE